ncbi:SDR family oxidoreductase [Bacillus cereus]|uniref:SDR family oxidoreductase n=1 Tax=Bacillus cereus TaxID=1396 RepID=UPI003CFE040E
MVKNLSLLHAVVGLTKGAALEYTKKRIRINVLCPSGVKIALTTSVEAQFAKDGYAPEELAEMVAYLASDKESYMIGSIVLVDGGLTL